MSTRVPLGVPASPAAPVASARRPRTAGARAATPPAATPPAATLHVDWTACAARGLCAELLPGLLELDEWGYPRALGYGSDIPVEPIELADARVAVSLCPRQALSLR
ncbi:hypothetical protein GCM10027515_29120 [Schumannella luteola]|uniref:Ferredoxin n=1 Tax=Schumannella luteola TaxID=472059 RepID=A0A852YNI3_9MICO|nr:ferredoxin [Schumannella luteola]NYG99289.1 ferredoxin [Schumannella luteola]TPX06025.1 ferredoxin [Schumannella luteola]